MVCDGVAAGAPFLESDTVRQAALASLPQRPAITAAVLDKAMEKVGLVILLPADISHVRRH